MSASTPKKPAQSEPELTDRPLDKARDLARTPLVPLRSGIRAGVRQALCTNENHN